MSHRNEPSRMTAANTTGTDDTASFRIHRLDMSSSAAAAGSSPQRPNAYSDPHQRLHDNLEQPPPQQQPPQQLRYCTCLTLLRKEFKAGNYSEVIDFGIHFLTQALDLPLQTTIESLQLVGTALISQRELQRARSAFEMQKKAIAACEWDHGAAYGDSRAKKRWMIRHCRNIAALEEADGHREEAVAMLVEQWRREAELFGPHSLRCLRTYLGIADLKSALGDNGAALVMLRHAADQLDTHGGKDRDVRTWIRIRRSVSELLLCTGDPTQAAIAAAHLQEVILTLQGLLIEDESSKQRSRRSSPQHSARRGPSFSSKSGPAEGHQEEEEGEEDTLDDIANPTTMVHNQGGAESGGGAPLAAGSSPSVKTATFGLQPTSSSAGTSSSDDTKLIEYSTALVQYADALLLSQGKGTTEAALSSLEEADGIFSSVCQEFDILVIRTRVKLLKLQHSMDYIPFESFVAALEATKGKMAQAEVRGAKFAHVLIELYEALGDMYATGKYVKEACDCFEKALSAARQLFAPDHEVCAVLQHKFSEVCISSGRYDDALFMLRELQQWCAECPSDRATPVPLFAIKHSMGNVMRALERFEEALALYRETLQLPEGRQGPTRARILGSMGAVYLTIGSTRQAVELAEESLRIRQKCYGNVHIEVAGSYHQLAPLYAEMGQLKDAMNAADRCMDIMARLGEDNADISTSSSSRRKDSRSSTGGQPGRRSTAPSVASAVTTKTSRSLRSQRSDGDLSVSSSAAGASHPGLQHPYYVTASRVKAACIREMKKTSMAAGAMRSF